MAEKKVIRSYADLASNPAYELLYEEYLDDIKTAGMVLRHRKSGARVCVLANDDENKVFCVGFKTPPTDNTGVPHIIEHSVLNGSKNFPSRDPFMSLAKSSLQTFLNAITFSDKTIYPVASCNDKDFKNLMHVYIDSVFYPNIYKNSYTFRQEGWHYELESPDGELGVNGVVYSEMKGALSSPDSLVYEESMMKLNPDTTYGVNSGGDPDFIPDLTYEGFLGFHSRYYHPCNSYIFIYGDCDMDERLSWMDENYLSNFDRIDFRAEITPQKHWGSTEPKQFTASYDAGEDDSGDKTYFSYATLAGHCVDSFESRACDILSTVLVNSDSAPLKRALISAGIGEDVYGGFEGHMIDNAFLVVSKNAKAGDRDRFLKVIRDTLREQVENGISEKAIRAAINNYEFNFREANYGGFPKGLDYAVKMLETWLYDDGAAFSSMHVLRDIEELKAKVGTGFYEDIVRRYILEPDHSIVLTLQPEKGLGSRNDEKLKEKLAAYKATLTPDEIKKIIDDFADLRRYQAMPPSEEELGCIPTLERKDIPVDTVPFTNEERDIAGSRAVFHDVDTNGITYAVMNFDFEGLPEEYLPCVGILQSVLGRMDTAKRTFDELSIDIKLNTGSIDFAPDVIGIRLSDDFRSFFTAGVRALADKVGYGLDTAAEIITTTKFKDLKRLKEILAEIKSDFQRTIMMRGDNVGSARLASYFSKAAWTLEKVAGLDLYFYVCDVLGNFDEKGPELAEKLEKTVGYIFDPSRMIVSIAADAAGYAAFEENLPAFRERIAELKREDLGPAAVPSPEMKNEAFIVPSPVNYICRGGKVPLDGKPITSALNVVNKSVNIDYLYMNIRVKGGAYGCGCSVDCDSGVITFSSYRDPNISATDKVYLGTEDFVRGFDTTEDELTKTVVGTFARFERPMSASQKRARSFRAYVSGTKYEDLTEARKQMLGITVGEFHDLAHYYGDACSSGCICAVGSPKIRDEGMYDRIVNIE